MESSNGHSNERSRLVYTSTDRGSGGYSGPYSSAYGSGQSSGGYSSGGYYGLLRNIRIDKWSKEQWTLVGSVATLMIATAAERVTFKMSIDRMSPFRVLLVVVILFFSSIFYCVLTLARRSLVPVPTANNDFPHYQILIMALMDTLQLYGLVISAAGVSPTMTVILLHVSTPCIVFASQWLFPARRYSSVQLRGVGIIALAVVLCLSRVTYYYILDRDKFAAITMWSSVGYIIFAALQGFITVYKERCIIAWSRPLDIYRLSAWLFYYQTMISIVLSPLVYIVGGYPIRTLLVNIYDGWGCLRGYVPQDNVFPSDDTDGEMCSGCIWLVFTYVGCTALVIECINHVLQISNQLLGRAMAAAVFLAFMSLALYDENTNYGVGYFGTNVGIADILSVFILIYGMEVYGRDPEPDVEVITNLSI